MPFVANTPESYLNRTDSLNPDSTCRGITSSGKPCRRPTESDGASGRSKSRAKTPDPSDENNYCWQHKDQAKLAAKPSSGSGSGLMSKPIFENRTSLDTLADRLGLMDVNEKPKWKWGSNNGRISSDNPSDGEFNKPPRTDTQKRSFFNCCCFSIPLDNILEEEDQPPRPQPHPVQHTGNSPTAPARPPGKKGRANKAAYRGRKPDGSQTTNLQNLIPAHLDQETQEAIKTELARPFVDSDEPGFIYMFWLTPLSDSKAPTDAARSLLSPPSSNEGRSRRPSEIVSKYTQKSASHSKTMKIKIGRAQNVQRRMNQWQRQCGYDIDLLRYYPYVSSSDESSGIVPHMTPHVHRVERLIHIELEGMGKKVKDGKCDACGTMHREWFEVDATREAVREADKIIRRWIEWDEANG